MRRLGDITQDMEPLLLEMVEDFKFIKIKFKGRFFNAKVSTVDFDIINKYSWHIKTDRFGEIRACKTKIENKTVSMHRLILNLRDPKIIVDHKNGNPLDNTRQNLRICNQSQNIANSRLNKRNTSGYKGVTYMKSRRKWIAQIKVNYKNIFLGYFDDPYSAHIKYIEAAKFYFNEFARISDEKN